VVVGQVLVGMSGSCFGPLVLTGLVGLVWFVRVLAGVRARLVRARARRVRARRVGCRTP